MNMNDIAKKIQVWAKTKGWDSTVKNTSDFGDKIALMHSELSEALEEFRKGEGIARVYFRAASSEEHEIVEYTHEDQTLFQEDPKFHKPEGVPIELADTIIRILHFCADNDIDIERAVEIKMKYNETRSFRHGGKLS